MYKGAPGKSYKDSQEVKEKFRKARNTKQACHWKEVMRARKQARMQWEQERLDAAASGDWQAVRRARRKQDKWQTGFAEATQGHRRETIHEHLAKTYTGDDVPEWEETEEVPTPKLRDAAAKGAVGKAVGVDGVSHELLQAVCQDDVAAEKLLNWYNEILQS